VRVTVAFHPGQCFVDGRNIAALFAQKTAHCIHKKMINHAEAENCAAGQIVFHGKTRNKSSVCFY
jgi:hypothetical protein